MNSRRFAALLGAALGVASLFMLSNGAKHIYYDYYFYRQVKEEYIAPGTHQRLLDVTVFVGLILVLYLAYRLLRYASRGSIPFSRWRNTRSGRLASRGRRSASTRPPTRSTHDCGQ